MYREISIENFRGFPAFHMRELGRVNLLVGTNNSGKSTILEAIELLSSVGNLHALWSITSRRGEQIRYESERKIRYEAAISHLFHGHAIDVGSAFRIESRSESGIDRFRFEIQEPQELEQKQQTLIETEEEFIGPLTFQIQWKSADRGIKGYSSVLTPRGGLTLDELFVFQRGLEIRPVRYITTAALSFDEIASYYDKVVLTNEEQILIDALNTIDPAIQRIAILGGKASRSSSSRGNIVLKCKDIDERIPIGTMGDGIWRMLGIAIALVTARNGVLLVDEIDTGLHHSVMTDMWRLVERTAERLNVQVFATTHSRDCYESLATIAHESVTEKSQVTIQRIERDKAEAVAYSERDIVIAAERGLEVR